MAALAELIVDQRSGDVNKLGHSTDLTNINQLASRKKLFPDASLELLVVGTQAITAVVQSSRDVSELRRVIPTADYLRDLLQQSSASLAQLNEAAALRLRTMRQIGVQLRGMNLRGGDRRSKSHDASLKLKDLGLTKDFASRCRKIASLDESVFESAVDLGLSSKCELTAAHFYRLAGSGNREVSRLVKTRSSQVDVALPRSINDAPQLTPCSVLPGYRMVRDEDLEEIRGSVDVLSRLLSKQLVDWLAMELGGDIKCAGVKQIPRYIAQLQSALASIKRTANATA